MKRHSMCLKKSGMSIERRFVLYAVNVIKYQIEIIFVRRDLNGKLLLKYIADIPHHIYEEIRKEMFYFRFENKIHLHDIENTGKKIRY